MWVSRRRTASQVNSSSSTTSTTAISGGSYGATRMTSAPKFLDRNQASPCELFQLRVHRRRRRHLHLPGEPAQFEPADDEVAGVELPPAEAVAGGGRERVVVVVPPLAETDHAEDGVVAALVVAAEGARAPEVADGVDAPGHVVDEEDAGEPAPDEPEERAGPRPCDQPAEDGRDQQAHGHPEGEQDADAAEQLVRVKVGNVSVEARYVRLKNPAD